MSLASTRSHTPPPPLIWLKTSELQFSSLERAKHGHICPANTCNSRSFEPASSINPFWASGQFHSSGGTGGWLSQPCILSWVKKTHNEHLQNTRVSKTFSFYDSCGTRAFWFAHVPCTSWIEGLIQRQTDIFKLFMVCICIQYALWCIGTLSRMSPPCPLRHLQQIIKPDQESIIYIYSSEDTYRKTPVSVRHRRTLNVPALRTLALGLTWAANTHMVTVQHKTRPLGTRPDLRWKRELSVPQEKCGPNWQRNTQAVGRSQITCTHTTFTSIIELWSDKRRRKSLLPECSTLFKFSQA